MMKTVCCLVAVIGLTTAAITGPCGLDVYPIGRIIGGFTPPRCTWPYTSLVYFKALNQNIGGVFADIVICSGVLISDRYILTTGTCGQQINNRLASTQAVVGDHDTMTPESGTNGQFESNINVEMVRIHPDFNSVLQHNNIALVRLVNLVTFNNCKHPACLPSQYDSTQRASCESPEVDPSVQIAGFGQGQLNGDLSRYAQVGGATMYSPAISAAISSLVFPYPLQGVLLAKPDAGVSPCSYDWGGLAVSSQVGSNWTLRGLIHSSSLRCFVPQAPEEPMRLVHVAQFRNWIDTCTDDFSACVGF